MANLQKNIASNLFTTIAPILNIDLVALVYVLIAFFSRLEQNRGTDFLGLLQDAVNQRVDTGRWPSSNDDYGFNNTFHVLSPNGIRFSLWRDMNSDYPYWYMYRRFPNQKVFKRYVGKYIDEVKLLQIYEEYVFLLPKNLKTN